jgi:hypothetical protein
VTWGARFADMYLTEDDDVGPVSVDMSRLHQIERVPDA